MSENPVLALDFAAFAVPTFAVIAWYAFAYVHRSKPELHSGENVVARAPAYLRLDGGDIGKLGVLLLPAFFCILLLTACSGFDGVPSPDSVQRAIESSLEPGASLGEIQRYLASEEGKSLGIEGGAGEVTRVSQNSYLRDDLGLPPDTPVYSAIVRGELHGLEIFLLLDDELRFQRVIVKDYYTGP